MVSVVSVTPANGATGVILGGGIQVTFNTIVDQATVTNGSFAVISPAGTMIITPEEEIQQNPSAVIGKQSVPGTFAFTENNGQSVVTFTPTYPLRPNITYTVLMIGAGAFLVKTPIKGIDGSTLDKNYSWSFTTGTLDLSVPPTLSPLVSNNPDIDPATIIVKPRVFPNPNGYDLTQEIDIVFPGPIDITSFSMNDLLLSIDPILGDPSISVPSDLVTTATVLGNIIKIQITGWPA